MVKRSVRFLALICGLTFAFPPGWCCLPARSIPAAIAPPSSCCCCDSCFGEKPPSNPANAPTAPKPTHCPCTDRQTILASSQNADRADVATAIVAILSVLEVRPPEAGSVRREVSNAHPPPLRMHVLHCQWLC